MYPFEAIGCVCALQYGCMAHPLQSGRHWYFSAVKNTPFPAGFKTAKHTAVGSFQRENSTLSTLKTRFELS